MLASPGEKLSLKDTSYYEADTSHEEAFHKVSISYSPFQSSYLQQIALVCRFILLTLKVPLPPEYLASWISEDPESVASGNPPPMWTWNLVAV